MMLLPEFTLHRPDSLEDAARLASAAKNGADFLGGGTDLLCNYKWDLNAKPEVVSLRHIPDFDAVERRADGSWRIGAGATLHHLENQAALMTAFPGLHDSLSKIASPLIRRTATLGGNLLQDTRCHFFNQSRFWRTSLGFCLKAEGTQCHVIPQAEVCYATYHGDVAPVLMALDASGRFVSSEGERTLKLHEFFGGEGRVKHCKKPGEILAEVIIPSGAESLRSGYSKLRLRDAFDFPAMGVGAALQLENGVVKTLRISLTAILQHPYRCDKFTEPLIGGPLDAKAIRDLSEALKEDARPVKSMSTPPPDYRKKMVAVYTRRLLERLVTA